MTHAATYAKALRYAADSADPADHLDILRGVADTYRPLANHSRDFDHAALAAYADYLAAVGDATAPVVAGHFALREARPGVAAFDSVSRARLPGHRDRADHLLRLTARHRGEAD